MEKKKLKIEETFTLAFQNHQKNNIKEAEVLYKKILEVDPNHLKSIFYLGSVLAQTKNFDKARKLFKKAIQIQPNYAEAHNNLGYALKELGKLSEAVASFQKALTIKPDYITAYLNHGLAKELQKGKKPFNPQLALNKCIENISLDKRSVTVKILCNLSINDPFSTQKFVKIFIDNWCETINRMLNSKQFDIAGTRIRWLYMQIIHHKPFNLLIQKYFNKIKNKKIFEKLKGYEKAVHLAMKSQYFYENNQYNEAEDCSRQCINEIKIFLKNKTLRSDGWLLVKKSLRNIKDSGKARIILEQILQGVRK